MNALLTAALLACGLCLALFIPVYGSPAVFVGAAAAVVAGYFILKAGGEARAFLLQIFIAGLIARVLIGTAIFTLRLQDFFGGDALTYDELGKMTVQVWQGGRFFSPGMRLMDSGWGMAYLVGAVYSVVGRNMLAVQMVNSVVGAATAPVIYLCAQHIFRNSRASRLAAFFVAFYPSLVLWSSQGLKDGPLVFLLALAVLATLRLGERLSLRWAVVLSLALVGIQSLRFYVFYMLVAAIAGSFVIGMREWSARSLLRQVGVIVFVGLAITYLGVLRQAPRQLETYTSLQRIQTSRADLAGSARSGFGRDVDVSTTSGALSAIPLGAVYLLFAPFPWQLANLRQSITLPEMVVWWTTFPALVVGLWYTLGYRLRQALPILIFTSMLTLAYSVFQGNVGTAYRQRSQLLVFYFIFTSVGVVLLKERQEDRKRQATEGRLAARHAGELAAARRRRAAEWEAGADRVSGKVGF